MNESRRLDAVDVARGLSLVAMAGYHLTWDLAYFGVVAPATPFTPPMRFASHAIGSAFLGLAGYSLALAHGRGFRLRPFLRRLARIGAAAALVSGATYAIAPQSPIFFGILHCIFAASVIAAPFLMPGRGPAALAAALALIALPLVYASPAFNPPWLVWLGLGTEDPPTLDWRPLAPWAGVTLLGLAIGLLAPAPPFWRAKAAALRAAAFAGRHSLAVYLIHQPILVGLLYAGLQLSGFSERLSVENYVKACRPACVEAGGEIAACARACACVVRDAGKAGLAGRLSAPMVSAAERDRIGRIVKACGDASR